MLLELPHAAAQDLRKNREEEISYSSLVSIGWALLAEPRIFLSLAVMPLEALIHNHLETAVLLSHLHFTPSLYGHNAGEACCSNDASVMLQLCLTYASLMLLAGICNDLVVFLNEVGVELLKFGLNLKGGI